MAAKQTPITMKDEDLKNWILAKRQKQLAEQEMKRLEAAIVSQMRDNQEVKSGIFGVVHKRENYRSFDAEAFKGEHPELYDEYIVTKDRKVFKVTVDEMALMGLATDHLE